MFKRWLNQGQLAVQLAPRGPIMIKSGRESVDPSQPDMAFIRTTHPLAGETVYLPGTSLKGVIRAHTERLLRGAGVWVCDPLAGSLRAEERSHGPLCRKATTSRERSGPHDTATVFRLQCPACRTFGSLAASGHVSILDAYPWSRDAGRQEIARSVGQANRTERRMQAAIDRETGQAAQSGALYEIEVVTGGTFWTEIHFENVQLWQLAVILNVLADIDSGDVGIGFGKARGLGRIQAKVTSLELSSLMPQDATTQDDTGGKLFGVGALVPADEEAAYGLLADDSVELPPGIDVERTWRGQSVRLDGSGLRKLGPAMDEILGRTVPQLDALRQTS